MMLVEAFSLIKLNVYTIFWDNAEITILSYLSHIPHRGSIVHIVDVIFPRINFYGCNHKYRIPFTNCCT